MLVYKGIYVGIFLFTAENFNASLTHDTCVQTQFFFQTKLILVIKKKTRLLKSSLQVKMVLHLYGNINNVTYVY